MDKARAAMAYIGERNPTLSVSTLKVLVPFRRPEDSPVGQTASEWLDCRSDPQQLSHVPLALTR